MNPYIENQIKTMKSSADLFAQSCRLAAIKDDGKIDRDEEHQLRRIDKAVERFKAELDKVK